MTKRLTTIIVATFVLVACETTPVATTSVNRVLMAPDIQNAPYSNILIVGAMPGREADRRVEEGLIQELKSRRVSAHSFVLESPAKSPSEEDVFALVNDKEIDGVIVVTARYVGAELSEHGERTDIRATARGGSFLDYFRYDYKEVTSPGYADATSDVIIVSDFYDAASRERVYSVESSTAHGQTSYEIIMAESKAIVRRLRKDGLIK